MDFSPLSRFPNPSTYWRFPHSNPQVPPFSFPSSYSLIGTIPCCRSSFLGLLFDDCKVFIHGGTNEDLDLHDSYILDLNTMIWSNYPININCKLTLVGHSGLLIPNEEKIQSHLLIFGGWDGSKYIDTCYLLNLENNSVKVSFYKGWTGTSCSVRFKQQHSLKGNLTNAKSWGGPKPYGSDIPSSRRDHTLTHDYLNNKVYLFGGKSEIPKMIFIRKYRLECD